MRFARTLLVIAALIFVGIGIVYSISPLAVVAVFPDGAIGTADGRTEIRAVYGGLELGLGLFFALGAIRSEFTRGAVACAGLISLFAGLIRASSFAIEGEIPGMNLAWAVLEVAGGIVAFAAYRSVTAETGARAS